MLYWSWRKLCRSALNYRMGLTPRSTWWHQCVTWVHYYYFILCWEHAPSRTWGPCTIMSPCDLKELLSQKKRAFREEDRALLTSVEKQLKVKLRECKKVCKKKYWRASSSRATYRMCAQGLKTSQTCSRMESRQTEICPEPIKWKYFFNRAQKEILLSCPRTWDSHIIKPTAFMLHLCCSIFIHSFSTITPPKSQNTEIPSSRGQVEKLNCYQAAAQNQNQTLEGLCEPTALWHSTAFFSPGEGSGAVIHKTSHPFEHNNNNRLFAQKYLIMKVCFSRQVAPFKTSCSLFLTLCLELKIPTSTCFSKLLDGEKNAQITVRGVLLVNDRQITKN